MWHVRLWRSPPTEAFIIYDESSSPGADDYLIDADYSMETHLYKNPAPGKAVRYAQLGLKLQSRCKKLILTTKLALVIQMVIVCVKCPCQAPFSGYPLL